MKVTWATNDDVADDFLSIRFLLGDFDTWHSVVLRFTGHDVSIKIGAIITSTNDGVLHPMRGTSHHMRYSISLPLLLILGGSTSRSASNSKVRNLS
jgi:hypothetical protein